MLNGVADEIHITVYLFPISSTRIVSKGLDSKGLRVSRDLKPICYPSLLITY